jgi:uncharacterized protein (DUF58 family)
MVRIDLAPGDEATCFLSLPLEHRGWNTLGPVKIESRYPFGLLRCWTWFDPDVQVLAWPMPVVSLPDTHVSLSEGTSAGLPALEGDIDSLDQWQQGEPMSRVAWRQTARLERMLSRQFESGRSDLAIVHWQQWARLDLESRLSAMAWEVLQRHNARQHFELVLPGESLSYDGSERAFRDCMDALALYNPGVAAGA